MHGRHADDLAGGAGSSGINPLLQKPAHRLARGDELAREVHVDHPAPCLERHLGEGRVLLDAGVRHQDVDTSERAEEGVEHGFHLRLIRHVGLESDGLAPSAADFADDAIRLLRVRPVVDADRPPPPPRTPGRCRRRRRNSRRSPGPSARAAAGRDHGHGSFLGRGVSQHVTVPASVVLAAALPPRQAHGHERQAECDANPGRN